MIRKNQKDQNNTNYDQYFIGEKNYQVERDWRKRRRLREPERKREWNRKKMWGNDDEIRL